MSRDRDIYESICDGESFTNVGKRYGFSRQRAAQIYDRARIEYEERSMDPLSVLLDSFVPNRRLANQILNTLSYYSVVTVDDLCNLSDYQIITMKRFGPFSENIVMKMRDQALKGGY